MSGTHSLLAPSDSVRWARCAGALHMSRGVTDPAKQDAASGTCSHWLGAWALEHPDQILSQWLGVEQEHDGFTFKIDQDRIDRVQTYVDAVNREPGQLWVEKRVDTSPIYGIPGQEGHSDAIKLDATGVVEIYGQQLRGVLSVHDLKDGAGHVVYARNNLQGLGYAASALYELDLALPINVVRFCIHQPRLNHYDEWSYTRAEIEAFTIAIRPAAKLAWDIYHGNVEFDPAVHLVAGDEQCLWCPVRGRCPARAKRIIESFAPIINRHELDDKTKAMLYDRLDEIESACRDYRNEMLRSALMGAKIEGHKLVRGKRGQRYWKDEKKAEETLQLTVPEDKLYKPREIVSPTQIEKVLKKEGYAAVKQLVGQDEGNLTLVKASDKRDEVVIQQFPVLTETEPAL